MSPRTTALAAMASALVLLGATVADWATTTVTEPFGEEVVVERTETIAGPEVAGGLITAALLALVVTGLAVRWPLAGSILVPLGGYGAVVAADGLTPVEGTASAAPAVALAASAGLLASGVAFTLLGIRRRRTDSEESVSARTDRPSRYTVEAVRGEQTDDADEWDLAVLDDPAATEDET